MQLVRVGGAGFANAASGGKVTNDHMLDRLARFEFQ